MRLRLSDNCPALITVATLVGAGAFQHRFHPTTTAMSQFNMFNELAPAGTLPPLILTFLRGSYTFFAETAFPNLIFLACIVCVGRSIGHVRYSPSARWARTAGLLTFLAFCLYAYITAERPATETVPLFALGVRGVLALVIVDGTAALILPSIAWLWSMAMKPFRFLRRRVAALWRRISHARLPSPTPQPIAPHPEPSPPLHVRVEQLKREYESTCETLRTAGLDADELDVALDFARQRYLRRLYEITRQ